MVHSMVVKHWPMMKVKSMLEATLIPAPASARLKGLDLPAAAMLCTQHRQPRRAGVRHFQLTPSVQTHPWW